MALLTAEQIAAHHPCLRYCKQGSRQEPDLAIIRWGLDGRDAVFVHDIPELDRIPLEDRLWLLCFTGCLEATKITAVLDKWAGKSNYGEVDYGMPYTLALCFAGYIARQAMQTITVTYNPDVEFTRDLRNILYEGIRDKVLKQIIHDLAS